MIHCKERLEISRYGCRIKTDPPKALRKGITRGPDNHHSKQDWQERVTWFNARMRTTEEIYGHICLLIEGDN